MNKRDRFNNKRSDSFSKNTISFQFTLLVHLQALEPDGVAVGEVDEPEVKKCSVLTKGYI